MCLMLEQSHYPTWSTISKISKHLYFNLYLLNVNIQGFEEETPYIRIGNTKMKGTKVSTVGTDLIFEVDESKTTLNGRE